MVLLLVVEISTHGREVVMADREREVAVLPCEGVDRSLLFDPRGRAAFDVLHEVAEGESFVEAHEKVNVVCDAAGVEEWRVEVAADAACVGEEVGEKVEGD